MGCNLHQIAWPRHYTFVSFYLSAILQELRQHSRRQGNRVTTALGDVEIIAADNSTGRAALRLLQQEGDGEGTAPNPAADAAPVPPSTTGPSISSLAPGATTPDEEPTATLTPEQIQRIHTNRAAALATRAERQSQRMLSMTSPGVVLSKTSPPVALGNLFLAPETDVHKECICCRQRLLPLEQMVRLVCLHEVHAQCFYTWQEAEESRETGRVRCPECNIVLHHTGAGSEDTPVSR